MMNEDKILELLAEYLRKTDQIMERLDKHALVWSSHQEIWSSQQEAWSRQEEARAKQEEFRVRQDLRLDVAYQALVAHSEKIERLQQESTDLRIEFQKESADLRRESNELRQQSKKIEIRTDATWKQFIAVAKKFGINKGKR